MTTVLFTQKNSIYNQLGCNCYDITRNALTFNGNEPIIAHPPCRSWGKYRHKSKATHKEYQLTLWSLRLIRKNGGILEHPYSSNIRKYIPKPGNYDKWNGTTIIINQNWFGHPCKKETLLYICGLKLSEIPSYMINFNLPTSKVENQSKHARNSTPIKLAKYLINIINLINGRRCKT